MIFVLHEQILLNLVFENVTYKPKQHKIRLFYVVNIEALSYWVNVVFKISPNTQNNYFGDSLIDLWSFHKKQFVEKF